MDRRRQEDEEEEEADWEAVYARAKPREDSFRPGIQSNARLPFSADVKDKRPLLSLSMLPPTDSA